MGLKVFVDATSVMYLNGLRGGLRGDAGSGGLQVRESECEEHLRLRIVVQRVRDFLISKRSLAQAGLFLFGYARC